jgi:hypothetical protein
MSSSRQWYIDQLMKKSCWTLATLVVGLALAGSPASAQQNITCTGTPPSGTYNNVNVPTNAFCRLFGGVTVSNVSVASGATLEIDRATVDGNIASTDASEIVIVGTVGGNIRLIRTTSSILIESSSIDGNMQIVGTNSDQHIFLDSLIVGGNVTLANNTSGRNLIESSTIAGNLTCVNNTPAPTNVGHPNTVTGNNQCGL